MFTGFINLLCTKKKNNNNNNTPKIITYVKSNPEIIQNKTQNVYKIITM